MVIKQGGSTDRKAARVIAKYFRAVDKKMEGLHNSSGKRIARLEEDLGALVRANEDRNRMFALDIETLMDENERLWDTMLKVEIANIALFAALFALVVLSGGSN